MSKRLLLGSALALVLGAAAWFGWRWYTTPSLPDLPLEGADKGVAEVVEAARQDVRRQPRSGAAWGKLGMVLTAHNLSRPAIVCYANAERFDPENPRWPYLHGAEVLPDNPPEGIDLLRRALTLARSPSIRAVVLFRLTLVLIENGRLDEAESQLQVLKPLDEVDGGARSRFALGLLANARGDRETARKYLAPLADHPSCQKRTCALLATLGGADKDQVRRYRERADRLPADQPWPDPFEAAVMRCKVDSRTRTAPVRELEGQGRHGEALVLLRKLVAEKPDSEVCFYLGHNRLKARDFPEAAESFRAAISLDPNNPKAHLFLGEALLEQGEKELTEGNGRHPALEHFRQAVAAEDQALALQGDLGSAHLIRGKALGHLGRTEEALKALRQAVLCQAESPEVHLALGEALTEAGQRDEAIIHLENAVRLADPNDRRPRDALAKWRAGAKPAP